MGWWIGKPSNEWKNVFFNKIILQPHSLMGGSGSRHRLSVSNSNKSMKQSMSYPAISDIIKTKVGNIWYIEKCCYCIFMQIQGPPSSLSVDNFQQLPPPISPEVLSPTSPTPPSSTSSKSKDYLHLKRRVKSPELHETTFTMSTIEEEIESVNYGTYNT